jgi:hypothetical protein
MKAIVVDHRNAVQLHENEYVGVYILMDEHQLLYVKFKKHYKLNVEYAVKFHKDIFSGLMELKADQEGTKFCHKEHYF